MKIPGKKGSGIDTSELLRTKQKQQNTQQAAQAAAASSPAAGADKVDVGLTKAIQNLVSIEELQEEREARKARLKELVQSGKYSVPSEDIAQRLSEDIAYEIAANSREDAE